MRAGGEVGAFFIVAHKAPRIVVGIGEAPSLHGGGGGEVVALPKHETDEAVREILVEERAVVERNLALIKSVEVERDAVGGIVAGHIGHGALRNADAVAHALIELQGGDGVEEYLIVLGGDVEFLVSFSLAFAIYFGSRALIGFHLRVEGEDEGICVGVDAKHGSPVLRRAGREGHGRIGASEEGNVDVVVGTLGIAGNANRAGGNVERIVLSCLEIALAELYRDGLGGAVGLERYGGVDFFTFLVAQFNGIGRAEHGDVAVEGDADFLQLGNGHAARRVGSPGVEQVDALGGCGDAFGQRHDVRFARAGKDADAAAVVGEGYGCAGVGVGGIFQEIEIIFLREDLLEAHPVVALLHRPLAIRVGKGRRA